MRFQSLQVVRGPAPNGLARLRWRRERRLLLSSPKRSGLDHRQGWHRRGTARRQSRLARIAIRETLTELGARSRRSDLRANRRTGNRKRESLLAALTPMDVAVSQLAGEDILKVLRRRQAMGVRLAASRSSQETPGSRPALLGREKCTRSMLKLVRGKSTFVGLA